VLRIFTMRGIEYPEAGWAEIFSNAHRASGKPKGDRKNSLLGPHYTLQFIAVY